MKCRDLRSGPASSSSAWSCDAREDLDPGLGLGSPRALLAVRLCRKTGEDRTREDVGTSHRQVPLLLRRETLPSRARLSLAGGMPKGRRRGVSGTGVGGPCAPCLESPSARRSPRRVMGRGMALCWVTSVGLGQRIPFAESRARGAPEPFLADLAHLGPQGSGSNVHLGARPAPGWHRPCSSRCSHLGPPGGSCVCLRPLTLSPLWGKVGYGGPVFVTTLYRTVRSRRASFVLLRVAHPQDQRSPGPPCSPDGAAGPTGRPAGCC